MKEMKAWILFGISLLLAWDFSLAADPPYYVRKNMWHETMMASREALMKHETAEEERLKASPAPQGVTLGAWHVIGPFARKGESAFSDVFPPEQEIDLRKTYENGTLRWAKRAGWKDGVVQNLQGGDYSAVYLFRTITSPVAQTVNAYLGSDDGLQVWLNGKKIVSQDVPRVAAPNQVIVPLSLQAGENKLLMKVNNITGGFGYYFSLSPDGDGRDVRAEARNALWALLQRDFADAAARQQIEWEQEDGIWSADWTPGDVSALAQRYADAARLPTLKNNAKNLVAQVKDAEGLNAVREVYYRARSLDASLSHLRNFPFEPLQRAINDLTTTYKDKYPKGREFLTRLNALKKSSDELLNAMSQGNLDAGERAAKLADDLEQLQRDALLSNPALDFDRVLLMKRKANQLGLPQNWQGNSSIPRAGYDNEIAVLSPVSPDGKLTTLYKPDDGRFVGDLELHWDADRLLFSMPDSRNRWQVFEIRADGMGLRQVTPGDQADVDNYDGCYLPNGGTIFCSTANYQGVPCVGGADHVGLLYRMEADEKSVRQLTFDQDHSWCPTVLNDGRVLYTRWEYSDTPHYFSRLLFTMNPDGTQQLAYYGSNSYWPNSTFYARPIPGHPSKVVGVISGHHGVTRMGEMILFDAAKGRHEAEGVVQRIPGYGKKVEAVIVDQLVNNSFPKFLHPYPLNEKYYLVSCQPTPRSPWGIYLVDVFDNMLLLCEADGYAMFEPIPLHKQKKPPVIPDRVDVRRKDATVYVADVYSGPGMKGVPRGTVKRLRVFAKHFAYRNMGGHINIGIDGPWDVNAMIGTVPVYDDGSVLFRAPANTPLVVQPLDAEGKAVQIKRSWFTAMPGESVSCVGCHDSQNAAPPARATQALLKGAVEITPWYGPPRGFSFEREVQPMLDKYCVGCHNGQQSPDLRGKQQVTNYRGGFMPAYEALHRYVRRPGPESDYHLLPVMEYHADTSELVQMLKKGHYGVKLDAEAWDRLVTWIDLNVPCHGTWCEHQPIPNNADKRRRELQLLYAGLDADFEDPGFRVQAASVAPQPSTLNPQPLLRNPQSAIRNPECPGFPFNSDEAKRRQVAQASSLQNADRMSALQPGQTERKFDLGNGVTLELVYVPAGEFVMGDPNGEEDELPLTRVPIDKPFWMGKFEITNEQYRLFDPTHDSRYVSQYNKDQEVRGYPMNGAKQPVVRVSWKQAMAFCQWLSEKTGERFTLPTEAQWEYAARAGTATPFFFGDGSSDFSRFANLADATLKQMARRDSPDWIPKDTRFNDRALVTANVGSYQPNAWGLHDMIGNAAEWTRSAYKPYGGNDRDDRDDGTNKVVRGGSWYDRPHRSRASFRLSYPSWQGVYNVGFRVMCEVR